MKVCYSGDTKNKVLQMLKAILWGEFQKLFEQWQYHVKESIVSENYDYFEGNNNYWEYNMTTLPKK